MQIDINLDCTGIDWQRVSDTLKQVGMGYYEPDLHRTAFENSYVTVFACSGGRMVGFEMPIECGKRASPSKETYQDARSGVTPQRGFTTKTPV